LWRLRFHPIGQFRQTHRHQGSFPGFAFDIDFTAVQIDAALDDHQAQPGAGTVSDVSAAMEGGKKPFAVGLENPDAAITNRGDQFGSVACDVKVDVRSGLGIFDRVRQQICEDVAQQALARAQSLCPVDTGELRDSLHIEDAPDGGKRVVAGTDHWLFPEFGTSEMAAEPYLRPVIDDLGLHR